MAPAAVPIAGNGPLASAPVEITTGITADAWDAYVGATPHATRYHLWRWREVFEDAFGHQTVYLAARRDGDITGILPLVIFRNRLFGRCAVSLPFVDGGGVCANDGATARLLVEHARQMAVARRLGYLELRHTDRQFTALAVRQHKVGMLLPLPSTTAAAWDALDRKVRNQIRKAEKSDLQVRSGGVDLLDAFYGVFARNMRDLGTPVYARRVFERVLATFAADTQIFVVERGSTAIAAAIAMRFRDLLAVPWASSLREWRSLCPNNLLYWRIIEQAIAERRVTFDFGRSTPGQGTWHFKDQWGAHPVSLNWEYALIGDAALPDLSPSNPRFSAAIALWKRVPVGIASWLGPPIVRHIP